MDNKNSTSGHPSDDMVCRMAKDLIESCGISGILDPTMETFLKGHCRECESCKKIYEAVSKK